MNTMQENEKHLPDLDSEIYQFCLATEELSP
jgi:hypothetical protein